MTNLEALKSLLKSGDFHHATYREIGRIHEGLWFYQKDPGGFRGYSVAGCINAASDSADMDEACALTRGSGVSIGSYGSG